MPLLRGRREQASATRYRMQEKLFAIGDDFWIENEAGERAFKVNGKALRVRDTLILESPRGEELYSIQQKTLHVRDTMEIERDGRKVATVKKALVTPLRDRISIGVEGGDDMEAKGNRDTYGIEITPGQDVALILATSVCIDQMTQDVG